MDDDPGPYRTAGGSRLGPVVRRFAIRRRRRSYAGSAASVAGPRPLLLGGLVPPPLLRAGASWSRSVVVRDAIELCAHGLRLRTGNGTLELTWDQVVTVEREELAGELHLVRVRGSHGEAVTFDRTVIELVALAAALTAAVNPPTGSP